MTSQTKFSIYKCDTCDRETEILLAADRPDPVRCNITLKCRGKLQRTGSRSARKFLFTPLVAGLDDYVPRGTVKLSATNVADPVQASIFTGGGSGMLAAGGIRRKVSGSNAQYYVKSNNVDVVLETLSVSTGLPLTTYLTLQLFEITPELLQYKKYTFVFTNTAQFLIGADNSPEGKNLRFDNSNKVRVYANGVELSAGEFNRTVDNQITLTPAITGTNNIIEVLVYNDIDILISSSELIPIVLRPLIATVPADLELRGLNCWGNWRNVIIDGVERIIAFGYDFALLDSDKSYGVARIEAASATVTNPVVVDPAEVQILLGEEPYAVQDKKMHLYLSGTTLVTDNAVLSYSRSTGTGALELSVDNAVLTEIYNPLMLSGRLTVARDANVQSSNNTLSGITPLPLKYIIGPS